MVNLHLVMRRHRKAKLALNEFAKSKQVFTAADNDTIDAMDKDIINLEQLMMVFIPRNFIRNELKPLINGKARFYN